MLETIGFVFPNDLHIHWSLMIVLYPYITGLVAGAFVVSSLYHVFDIEALKPVSRFALMASLAFLLVATWPLLLHLGHPLRGINVMITPNPTSAMAGFGYFYSGYMVILLVEVWLVFRKDIITYARRSRGLKQTIYKLLALGVYDTSEKAQAIDAKMVKFLAAIGIPGAFLLHGYVGFLFGALKSNPWWSTPLMPIIFIFSAVVSGIAALIVMYQVAMKLKGLVIDRACIDTMCGWLWMFLMITASLELLELVTLAYEKAEEWEIIGQLLAGPLSFSFLGLQMIVGVLIPFILLMIIVLLRENMGDKVANTLSFTAATLLLIQVFAMRWNVVIGGQMISKSLSGLREAYKPELFGKEGIMAAIGIMLVPFVIIFVAEWLLPMFRYSEEQTRKLQEGATTTSE
ncbi:MAG: NrfD/PsrC family molybdoenzyme membrane anchor subunit [bacterium]|nr:polysulfide reductase NrfD [bacterium]MDT8366635.1 NrfD/PsrC family molybdoenzyme membrane anchor subunit [bacterium]